MKLAASRRMDQALRALLHLAGRPDASAKAADVAKALAEPVSSVQQVLQSLTRVGLLTSLSSASGGYRLARDPISISLLEVIQAVEGPVNSPRCILRSHPCHWAEVCPVHRVWMEAIHSFTAALSRASLGDIIADDEALWAGTHPIPPDSHRARAGRRT